MDHEPQHHLAIDLGASTGRALLGHVDGTRIAVEEVHRFETPILEGGGHLFWDLHELEEQVIEGIRRALQAGSNVRSVSIDSWAVDYVPIGPDDAPLRDPYCYRDTRTRGMMEKAYRLVPRAEIYATTGVQFMPINTLYQVLADHEYEAALVGQTKRRLLIADYLQYRLSGRAVAELSMASTTQLMNVRRGAWATELMEGFGIDATTWPEIVPPATRLGPVVPPKRFGPASERAATIEVVAGCSHDTACAVAAVPADETGPAWAYVSCGTWALLGVERADPLLTDGAREAGFTNEVGLDGRIRFLKNLTGLWVLQECERAWTEEGMTFDYDSLSREAAAAAPAGHVVDLDDPRFAARGDMPQTLRRYCRERGLAEPQGRGAIVRLILESMAAAFRDKLAVLERLVEQRIERLHIVGGGSQNHLLCAWTARATNRTVIAGPSEATALGNLLIQARTMGTLPAGTSIREVVRASTDLRTYEPDELAVEEP